MTQWAAANLDQAELLELLAVGQRPESAGRARRDAGDPRATR